MTIDFLDVNSEKAWGQPAESKINIILPLIFSDWAQFFDR